MITFLILMLFLGLHFASMTHPLAMGLMLLMQSLSVALMTGVMAPTFWFSYILFLVFLGGLMVLFIYVTSLASNEMFSLSSTSLFSVMPLSLILVLSFFIADPWGLETNMLLSLTNLMPNLNEMLVKLYSYPTSLLTSFLIVYLLLTLIAVVSITKFLGGPLRVNT